MPGFEWFGEEERREVAEVLETGVLFRYGFVAQRQGRWKARELEGALCRRLGVRHCHAVSSGTAALQTALAACGIGAGDEVIVPPFTFVATIESVVLSGAVPVFAEIDETLCLDPERVRERITERTRAVLVVHMCGAMARIDALQSLCRERGLVLIEDTAQALGASFQGRALGTFGAMGCYSFDPVKTITAGEGGAVVTDDERLYHLAEQYADHGHDHLGGADRGADGHPIMGTNFRISELHAAVGLAQLRKLDRILDVQRRHKAVLRASFAQSPEIAFRSLPDPQGDSATFLSVLTPDAARARELQQELTKAGCGPAFYWYDNNWHYLRRWDHIRHLRLPMRPALHLLEPPPDLESAETPRSDAVMARTLSLPVSLGWDQAELERRARAIRSVLGT
ncbi:MAG TPA: DegT/DnrJ/EryC1/StrS family aminotransferase [Chromatiales bacterium]|nr:DegT/DnrJ/EryC1/StrS family aminotransferase [Chromatiales bacterium]